MRKLKIEQGVNKTEWNNGVISLNGCCFHSHEWSISSSERNNAKPLYLRWVDESGILQCAGFGLISGRSLAGFISNRTLSLGSFPACLNTSFLKNAIKEIIEYCAKSSITMLKINSFGTPFGTEVLQELGFSASKRWEFLIDLDMSEEELWQKINKKKGRKVRRAQKANLQVKIVDQLDQVMKFRKIALETQERKLDKDVFLTVGDEDQYEHLKNNIIDAGIGRLYLAYDGTQPVAGIFLVCYNKQAFYMLSAANEIGLQTAATDLIIWESIKDCIKEGYKIYSLGGLSESELRGHPLEGSGLYQFKKGFSADVYPCYKGILILRPTSYKIYNFLKKVKSGFQ